MSRQKFIELETDRLVLRRFKEDDLQNFYHYRSNPSVAIYQGWQDYTYEQAINFINSQLTAEINRPDTWVQIAIENKDNGSLIGDIGVHTLIEPNQVEIGFTLEPSYQNKGFATEALSALITHFFKELKKERLIAIAVEQNLASIKLLEKLGFKKDKKIENSYFKGQYVTEYEFELTQNEWKRLGDELNK